MMSMKASILLVAPTFPGLDCSKTQKGQGIRQELEEQGQRPQNEEVFQAGKGVWKRQGQATENDNTPNKTNVAEAEEPDEETLSAEKKSKKRYQRISIKSEVRPQSAHEAEQVD